MQRPDRVAGIDSGDLPPGEPGTSVRVGPGPRLGRAIDLAEKVLRRAASLPSEWALAAMSVPFVEDRFLGPRHERSLRGHRPRLPALDATGARIVADLERAGVGLTSLDELGVPGSGAFLDEARRIAAELAVAASRPENRGKHTLQPDAARLMAAPAIFQWGLADRLLAVVENYLGLPVAYDGFSYYYSIADGREAGPRQWHRDREDRKMIKIGVYISDVDEGCGPFQSVMPASNAVLCGPRRYRYRNMGDDAVASLLPPGEVLDLVTCTGPAGTVFFADTAQYYHRGKPPVRADRAAIFFGYFARPPRHPFLCGRSLFSPAQIRRLVDGLPPQQQAAALWTRDVHPALRLVPKNRVKV